MIMQLLLRHLAQAGFDVNDGPVYAQLTPLHPLLVLRSVVLLLDLLAYFVHLGKSAAAWGRREEGAVGGLGFHRGYVVG